MTNSCAPLWLSAAIMILFCSSTHAARPNPRDAIPNYIPAQPIPVQSPPATPVPPPVAYSSCSVNYIISKPWHVGDSTQATFNFIISSTGTKEFVAPYKVVISNKVYKSLDHGWVFDEATMAEDGTFTGVTEAQENYNIPPNSSKTVKLGFVLNMPSDCKSCKMAPEYFAIDGTQCSLSESSDSYNPNMP